MPPWVSWHAEALVFFGVFSAAGLVLFSSVSTGSTVPLPQPAWLAVALLIVVVAQRVSGRVPYAGDVWVVLFYVALALACLVLGYAASGADKVAPVALAVPRAALAPVASVAPVAPALGPGLLGAPATTLAWAVLLIGLGSAATGLVQTFDVMPQSDWLVRIAANERAGGQVAQANHFAIGLLMALVSAAYLFCVKQIGAGCALLLVAYLGLGLAMSQSRTGFFCALVIGAWWLWKQPVVAPLHKRWWGILVLGLVVGLFLAWPPMFDRIYFVHESTAARLTSGSPRFLVWPQLVEAVWARPWLGWGMLQVAPAHNSVAHEYAASQAFTYSHTVVLDAAIWLGIPLAVGVLGVALTWLWRRARAVQNLQSWYLFGLLLPVGVGSLMEFPYVYAYCLAPVLFAVGMLERELRCKPMVRLPARAAALAYVMLSLLMAWSAFEYFQVEEDTRVARFEALRVGKTPNDYAAPHIILLTQLSSLAASTRIVPVPGMSTAQIDLLKNTALRYPWTANGFRYASALALNGNQAEAWRQMLVMRAMQGEKMHVQLMDVLVEKLAEHQMTWQPGMPQR